MNNIKVGTSGYSIPDWKGTAYPAKIKESKMFDWYVNQFRFNMVEMNYTYYRQPTARTFQALVNKTPDDFVFTVKLFGGLTHDAFKDYPPTSLDYQMCDEFIEGIKPLIEAGKLGCILAQFPASLLCSPEMWGYLLSLPDALDNLPLVYEFRNKGWVSAQTFDIMRASRIGFCAVDEPKMGALMPLVPEVTSDIGYLRLHGRSKHWFKNKDLRYDYLYSESELKSFTPMIENMASKSKIMFVALNNCHAGSAVQNVKMLKMLMNMEDEPMQRELF
jgi:uncharacterized protein YecE (DUF72 family)